MPHYRLINGLAILLLSWGLQSCASVFGGKHNHLTFSSSQNQEAQIFIDDSLVGQAPGKLKVPKEKIQHGSTLEIRAEGCETQSFLILRKPHFWYTTVNIFSGAVWLGVDYGNGNILRPVPRKFEYQLKETPQPTHETL